MALDNLVDGMTGLQMANVIKANFDKVLDAESAENKAENAGKSIKTDYDATRYIELQLADGTPVKMKMDVFCQAIAPVVAGVIGNPIGYKGRLDSTQDLNNLSDGIYCSMNTPNPTNSPDAYNYVLVQINHEMLPGRKFQIVFDGNDVNVWYRNIAGSSWGSWSKFTFT